MTAPVRILTGTEIVYPGVAAMRGSSMLLAAMVDASNRAGLPLCYLLGSKPVPKVRQIQRATATYFKISAADMLSERRSREVAWPRQVAMYLSRHMTPRSLPSIGRMFGDRDHTTVIHAIHAVEERMRDPESDTARAVRELTDMLEMGE